MHVSAPSSPELASSSAKPLPFNHGAASPATPTVGDHDDVVPSGQRCAAPRGPATLAFWQTPRPPTRRDLTEVCRLSRNPEVARMARAHGLDVVDVAWEDMARARFSSYGRNITDTTLRVRDYPERCSILRRPNFTDFTGDFAIEQFQVKVGNERGSALRDTPLRDYLNGLLANQGGPAEAIHAGRKILVAPQTCVLPLENGTCDFNVELFNYQSSPRYPAALAVVCTAEGTSNQVVTTRGAQKLFFNRDGRTCDFVAERLKQVRAREGRAVEGEMNAAEQERNILLLIQVPLRVQERSRTYFPHAYNFQYGAGVGNTDHGVFPAPYRAGTPLFTDIFPGSASTPTPGSARPVKMGAPPPPRGATRSFDANTALRSAAQGSDQAQLSVGEAHGDFNFFTERVALDPDAAIRCTVQHYLVTDEGKLGDEDFARMRRTMDAVYAGAERTGSLVVDADARERGTAPRASAPPFWFFR